MDLNGHGGTALHKACEEGDLELARILVLGGASLSAQAKVAPSTEGGTAQTWSPLHFAVKRGTLGIIDLLLGAGAPMGLETSAPSPHEIVMSKTGKGAHKARNAFLRVQKLIARRQTLAWATAMNPRLGDTTPVALLSPDLCSLVASLMPNTAEISVTDHARMPALASGYSNTAPGWDRYLGCIQSKSKSSSAAEIQSESF